MPSKNPGVMIAMFVVGVVYDMATTREAQSTAVVMLQHILIGGIAIGGLIGAVLRLIRSH